MEKYSWLLPSLEKAKKKYRDLHKDELNARSRQYYEDHKNDEVFREKCRLRSKEYYLQRKTRKNELITNEEMINL